MATFGKAAKRQLQNIFKQYLSAQEMANGGNINLIKAPLRKPIQLPQLKESLRAPHPYPNDASALAEMPHLNVTAATDPSSSSRRLFGSRWHRQP